MFKTLSRLGDLGSTAANGPIGNVKEAFFDDQLQAVRYLVVDAGSCLLGAWCCSRPTRSSSRFYLKKVSTSC